MSLEKFNLLTSSMFNHLMERDPVAATFMGLHQFDGEMPDGSRKRYLDEIESTRRYLSEFEGFDSSGLPPDKVIDRDLAVHGLELRLFEDETLRTWEAMPDAVNTVGDALFPLFTKDFAPFERRLLSIAERLEASPKFLEDSKSRITRPVNIWVKIAEETSHQLPLFLDTIASAARSRDAEVRRIEAAVEKLRSSLAEYEEWLSRELKPKAVDNFAIGPEKFEKLLQLRGFDFNRKQMLEFGESALREEKLRLEEIGRSIDPAAPIERIKEKIRADHPATFEEALSLVQRTVTEAREYVSQHSFATLPNGESLIVMETPGYMRHIIPFAAYFSPAKFDSRKVGIYITTRPEGGEKALEELNYASVSNTAVHEGYPGHHLQLTYTALSPSLIRNLFQGTEFVEGWAHYCEEAMKNIGWHDTPEARFMQTIDLIWRTARIVIDVKLSSGEMSFDEAVDFLVKETGMNKASATGEINRYTYTPGYQLSYYLGKYLIKKFRQEAMERWGDQYSDKKFHDLILRSGGLPSRFLHRLIENQ